MNTFDAGTINRSAESVIAATQALKEQVYWIEKLAGEWIPGSFPYDNRDEVHREPRPEKLEFRLSGELYSRLMTISKNSDLKLHMILTAGLAALLFKYNSASDGDMVIFTSIDKQEIEKEFINTILPLRVKTHKHMTFKNLLLQLRETVNEAFENQNYPIEVLMYDDLGLKTEDETSLMEVVLLLENIQDKKYIDHINNSMIFCFLRTDENLEGVIEYNSCLYKQTTIRHIAEHFNYMMQQAVFQVDLTLADISILTGKERKQILYDFNDNRANFPQTKSIPHFIREHAMKTPDHVAAEHEGKHLTYKRLNQRSDRLAHRLRGCGIAADERVGIIIERSPLLLEVILGIWKAGAAYIPIEIQYPKMRIVEILKDSAAKVLLAESRFPVPGLDALYQGEIIDPGLLLNQNENSEIEINMNSTAYVIYTSGSTGKPKGVMVEHIGMMNHIHAKINDLQLTGKSIIAQNSSYTFDISVWQFFAALIRGGKTVIYPYNLIIEPAQFIQRMIRDRLTCLEVVPSYLSVLSDAAEFNTGKIETLEYLLVTGEEVKHPVVEQWLEKFPHIKMVNAYGPTEASDDITHYIMDRVPHMKEIPIGQPLQNMSIYIVDDHMHLCPIGVKGEICVSGIGVGRGYLNNPELTAEKFKRAVNGHSSFVISSPSTLSTNDQCPMTTDSSSKLFSIYLTGDLGAWLPDGNIRFFGRKDQQVKIRGYRIELGEIECNLMEHQAIKEAVVIERKNPEGIQSLCAYLVPGEILDIREIKEYLSNRLPDYMVPDYFVEMDRIPLTPNGKIDRKALSKVEIHAPAKLPFISAEILKKASDHISPPGQTPYRITGEETEKFYDNLVETLENEQLNLGNFLEQTGGNTPYYPLSYPQRMMYYIEKRSPGTGCNNVTYTVKYREELDSKRLEQAFNHVLYKNDALRLRIVEIESDSSLQFAQYISDYKFHAIDRFDFTGKNSGTSMDQWLAADVRKGFDSLDNDLFYLAYIKFDENTSGYYVKIHHIICDAVSIHFILKEINKIYRHLSEGKTIDNKTNPSYPRYISDEREYLKSSRVKKDMGFWLDSILPPPEEIRLSPRGGETGNPRADICKLTFPQSVNQNIHEYCKTYKTSPFRLILAALSIYISRVCSLSDVIIGTLNNNRSSFQYTRMFGIFINFVPLRIQVEGNIGFNDFIKGLGKNIDSIINLHQEFPFEVLASQLGDSHGFDHRYFSNINLISHPDLEMEDFVIERHFTGFDASPLSIYINRGNKGIHGMIELEWVFQVERFIENEIEQIHHNLTNILENALANPDKKISGIELVSIKEKEYILEQLSRPASLPDIHIPPGFSGNPRIYILDENGMVQPVGIPGEIIVGDKYPPGKQEDFYPTGELARWLPDGNIEVLGSIRDIIHIKGIKIHLQKIENFLLSLNGVEGAVIVKKYNRGVTYLCAFIVLKKNLSQLELKEYMSGRFPPYMTPEHFIQLEKMPLTDEGSVDKKILERIDITLDMKMEPMTPGDEVERKLVEIWADVLGLETGKILMNSNFFELGGHSLSATVLASKIYKEFNTEITLADIFKLPEIAELSAYIKKGNEDKFISINPVEKKEYYVLSSAQRRLYILWQMDLKSTAYNMSQTLELVGRLKKEKFEKTIRRLIRRYESYRTSFITAGGEPVQRIHNDVSFEIRYYKTGTTGPAEKDSRVYRSADIEMEEIKCDFRRPFDLSHPPLIRVGLVESPGDRYLLLVEIHHIISDGVSSGIVAKNFMALYNEEEPGPLKIQYKDYSQWMSRKMNSPAGTTVKEFWLKEFSGNIPQLDMPTDYRRPLVQRFEGKQVQFTLSGEKTEALRLLALKENATLYMVLLSVYYLLFHKLSGQEDIIIGTPTAGRLHADIQEIPGMFLNMLALRTFPRGKKTFREFLTEVKEKVLAAFQHQDYPFEELVDKLELSRDTGRHPLFDVMFLLQNQEFVVIEIPGLKLKPIEYEDHTTKFDLIMEAFESKEGLWLIIKASKHLFNVKTVELFIDYFKNITDSVLKNDDIKISEINVIPGKKRVAILEELNRNLEEEAKKVGGKYQVLQEKINECLEICQNKIAIEYGDQSITYKELDQRSDYIANLIVSKGIKKEMFIAVLTEDRIYLISTILGILKAACVFIPLNPGYPVHRLKMIIQSTNIGLIFTDNTNLQQFSSNRTSIPGTEFIIPDDLFPEGKDSFHTHKPGIQYNPEDEVYIYYTSGTTGTPKAVLGKNRSLLHSVLWEIAAFNITGEYRVSQMTIPGFDPFLRDVFVTLCAGGVVCIPGNMEAILAPGSLSKWIERSRIRLLRCVPSLFRQIDSKNLNKQHFKKLECIMLSGEKTNPEDLDNWYDIFGDRIRFVNLYGPTETTLVKMYYPIRQCDVNRERIPIGKAMTGASVIILDKNMNICAPLIKGEIHIRTPFRSHGYWNDPVLNDKKFIGNPFNSDQDDVLYKTGDLGRVLPDGNIDILGRIDRQVKIRGYRIELEEIESVIIKHPAVVEAAVIKKELSINNDLLLAYVTPGRRDEKEESFLANLKEFLVAKLPGYMVPNRIIKIEKLPRKPNGKVDYTSLPNPYPDKEINYTGPGDKIEGKLVELWSEVLRNESIGVNDNFFELGGSSLTVMSLAEKIQKEFGIKISFREAFESHTIKEQAAIVKEAKECQYTSIKPMEKQDYYELSSVQNRIYILQQLDLKSTAYNILKIVVLEGNLDVERFKAAVKQLVRRHDALRTSFKMTAGEPVQQIRENHEVQFIIPFHDILITGGKASADLEIENRIKNFSGPFDLARSPLFKIQLIKVKAKRYILMVNMHHIISDATSITILIKEFMLLYDGKDLPPLRLQYKDFSKWQNKFLESKELKRQEEYWLKHFEKQILPLNLPADFSRTVVQSFEGDEVAFEISPEQTQALKNMALKTGSTLHMVLLAIYSIFLSKICHQQDIVIGIPTAGRRHSDLENIIGMFVNTLVIRVFPGGEKAFGRFLLEVKERNLEVFENQDYQIENLVEQMVGRRDAGSNPLFDVMFNLQNIPSSEIEVTGLKLEPYKYEKKVAKFDLLLIGFEKGSGIHLIFQYCTRRFKRETIEGFIRHFLTIAADVTKAPGKKLADIQVISEDEQKEMQFQFIDDLEDE